MRTSPENRSRRLHKNKTYNVKIMDIIYSCTCSWIKPNVSLCEQLWLKFPLEVVMWSGAYSSGQGAALEKAKQIILINDWSFLILMYVLIMIVGAFPRRREPSPRVSHHPWAWWEVDETSEGWRYFIRHGRLDQLG